MKGWMDGHTGGWKEEKEGPIDDKIPYFCPKKVVL